MRRREAVAMVGLVGASGCLRLTTSGNGTADAETQGGTADGDTAGTDAGTPTDGDGGGDGGSGLFASRSEAIQSVTAFVNSDEATPVEPYSGPDADLIRFTNGWGRTYAPGGNGSIVTAQHLQFEPTDGGQLRLGGDSDLRVRVRNLTFDTTLTFDPDPDASTVEEVTKISISPTTAGAPPDELELELDLGNEKRQIEGTWSGDSDIFRRQAIATYVVELLDGEEMIGHTAGKSFGTHYKWSARQTADALYVTRQPSVREAWVAELAIDEDPEVRSIGEHLVEKNAFRFAKTGLDLNAGQYDWTLTLGSDRPPRNNKIIRVSPSSKSLIIQ